MKQLIILLSFITTIAYGQYPDGKEVMDKVDKNMSSENRVAMAKMIVHGRRSDRTMEMKTWTKGDELSFSEYLSPPREKGTKMLKQKDKLWIYSPSTDRTIQISGHMLRQSMMGSDISYEDMMEDNKLTDNYNAKVVKEEVYNDRKCWVLELTANTEDITYYKRKVWVDSERYIPLKEELYAKSGKLLKKTELSNIVQTQGRWYPKKMIFKDMLKQGKGTEFIILDIQFDVEIPEYIFTKAALKK